MKEIAFFYSQCWNLPHRDLCPHVALSLALKTAVSFANDVVDFKFNFQHTSVSVCGHVFLPFAWQ